MPGVVVVDSKTELVRDNRNRYNANVDPNSSAGALITAALICLTIRFESNRCASMRFQPSQQRLNDGSLVFVPFVCSFVSSFRFCGFSVGSRTKSRKTKVGNSLCFKIETSEPFKSAPPIAPSWIIQVVHNIQYIVTFQAHRPQSSKGNVCVHFE